MAEVATGVLHNVGNVLNSVMFFRRPRRGKASPIQGRRKLAKAAALLTSHNGDLGEYLTK